MYQTAIIIILFIECVTTNSQPSLRKWLSSHSTAISFPISYIIHLEQDDIPLTKSKRSITQDIKTEETFISDTEIVTNDVKARSKRTIENSNNKNDLKGPNLHLKANLRYHHQQRHPNGSVSGSYGTFDPKGQLQVMHYVSDDKGYREYPENEPGSQASAQTNHPQYQQQMPPSNINVVPHSNIGNQPIHQSPHPTHLPPLQPLPPMQPLPPGPPPGVTNNHPHHHNARRGIPNIDNSNFVPNIAPPYSIPTQADIASGIPSSPILQSAVGSVHQYGPKSPLFDKYYRPSPEEVQRTYDYHRLRSQLDPNSFRPPEANNIPDIPRDKPPEIKAVYSEYQVPYSVRYRDETPQGYYVYSAPVEDSRHYNVPQYAPPQIPIDFQTPAPSNPQDLYPRPPMYYVQQQQPYPQTLPSQQPVYVYENPGFAPASTYNGPYVSNTATFNQPYPTNIPIYDGPLPQNVPAYNQHLPDNIPVYNQLPVPGYGQNVYYASGSAPQPNTAKNPR